MIRTLKEEHKLEVAKDYNSGLKLLFRRPEILKKIRIPDDVVRFDTLIDVLGEPHDGTNWVLQWNGIPVKVEWPIVTGYNKDVFALRKFVAFLELKQKENSHHGTVTQDRVLNAEVPKTPVNEDTDPYKSSVHLIMHRKLYDTGYKVSSEDDDEMTYKHPKLGEVTVSNPKSPKRTNEWTHKSVQGKFTYGNGPSSLDKQIGKLTEELITEAKKSKQKKQKKPQSPVIINPSKEELMFEDVLKYLER